MARPPSTFDRNTLGSNGSFPLRSMAGPPFAGSQLKNAGDFTAMAPGRNNPLGRSAAHLSKGVLGLAVDMRLVACRRWQLWVMGCRCDYVGITTAVPQIAADLLPLPKPAESGQSHRFGRTVTAAAYLQRTDLSDRGSAIPSRAITGGADHECVWPTALTGNAAGLLALAFWPLPNCLA